MSTITIVPFLQKVDLYILNPLLTLLFAVAFVYFLYGIIVFISAEGANKEKARSSILWGLVGMFVMVSAYGIIRVVLNTFQIQAPLILQDKLGN